MALRRVPLLAAVLLSCLSGTALLPAPARATGPTVIYPTPAKPPARGREGTPQAGTRPVKGALTLLYGDDHVFAIVPPPGWVVDDSSGLGAKIRVVLYPRGEKWATAQTVIYSNPLHQDPRAPRTFAQMLQRDLADFHSHAPRGKVTSGPPIRNVKGQQAEVRYFAPDGGQPVSAVAYFEEKDLVMLLVLESKTAAGFRAALPGFNGMVSSYQFVGSNMPTPTNRAPGR